MYSPGAVELSVRGVVGCGAVLSDPGVLVGAQRLHDAGHLIGSLFVEIHRGKIPLNRKLGGSHIIIQVYFCLRGKHCLQILRCASCLDCHTAQIFLYRGLGVSVPQSVVLSLGQGDHSPVFSVSGQEVIGAVQILPALIQVGGNHGLITRRGQVVHKEVPAVLLAVVRKGGRTFHGAETALADVALHPGPFGGFIVPPVFCLGGFHDNLFRVALGNMVGLSVGLKDICVDPSRASAVQEQAAVLPGVLGKVCGHAVHNVRAAAHHRGMRLVRVHIGRPVYDKGSLALSVVVRHPGSLRRPHHAEISLRFAVGI